MQKNTAHFQVDFQTHYTLPYQVFRCSVFYKIVINLYKYSNENVVLCEQKKGFRPNIHIYIKLLKERSFFCPNSFPSCCNNTVMIRNDQTNFTTQRVVVQYVKISNFHYIFTLICLDLVE